MLPFIIKIAQHITRLIYLFHIPHPLIVKEGFFGCIGAYIPFEVAYSLWHGFFVVLGLLVIGLMRSILPLVASLMVLGLSLYIDFAQKGYSPMSMLLFILMMVNISLILYTANPRFRQ